MAKPRKKVTRRRKESRNVNMDLLTFNQLSITL